MTISVIKELNFYDLVIEELSFDDLLKRCWSGAIDTLNTIRENNKEDEFLCLLDEFYSETPPTLTKVSNLLRLNKKFIFDNLGISESEDE